MKKILLGVVAILTVLGSGSAWATNDDDKDKDKDKETPTVHQKLDICHNNHIIPVSVHAADKIETGHGLFDPNTHEFTARVDAPGHEGDTVLRYYSKVGNEERDIWINPNQSCTGGKEPDSDRKFYIHVCVNNMLEIFEGTNLEELQAEVDAFIAGKADGQIVKVGTDCVAATTTTTLQPHPGSTAPTHNDPSPSEPNSNGSSPSEPDSIEQLTMLPRTGGTNTIALMGAVSGALGLLLLIGTQLWKRLTKG